MHLPTFNRIEDWYTLLVPFGILAMTVLGGFLLRNILFRLLRRWRPNTVPIGEIVMESLRGPIIIWALMFGIYFGLESTPMPSRWEAVLSKSTFALWIVSLTVMFTHLAGNWVKYYSRRGGNEMPATSLTKNVVQIGVVAVGTGVLLRHLGVSITPIVTALGVGGLAVALALQDTLGNLFGGFYITIAGQVRLGDYVRLSSGEEGAVVDISWRSTTLRGLSNNMVIVPNSKLAQAIVTNFHLPDKRLNVQVQVGVSYSSDASHVEAVLTDIVTASVGEIEGLLGDPLPSARLLQTAFGDSALQFTLTFPVEEFSMQYKVAHEIRKRILTRFAAEKIDMPFPTQVVHLKQ